MISFKGRISRKPFFVQTLILGIVQFLNLILTLSLDKTFTASHNTIPLLLVSLVSLAISIGVSIYIISLNIRRWHDLGKSGWWTLITLIPVVNFFIWLYLIFKVGDSNVNKYGSLVS